MSVIIQSPAVARASRRNLLKIGGIGGLLMLAGGVSAGRAQTPTPVQAGTRKRVLRLAHITDPHVQPERAAALGFTQCLQHIHAQPDPVELILNTGDTIYDSMGKNAARTTVQWDLWHKLLSDHNRIRMETAIGNHDVWGWNKTKSKTTGDEKGWGKARALDALDLSTPYRSFDHAGWHFVVLDSISPSKESYHGRLDEAQFAWLEADLKAVDPKTPVLVMSHIPIFSITPLVHPNSTTDGSFAFGAGAIHIDGMRIKELFELYPNVKVAVSGHQHLVDRVDYNGVSYLCNGAVSGGWWKQTHLDDCDAGYALMNLYDDGSFDRDYVNYGWTYQPDAKA